MQRWDIFCRVVDHFGDIGVCWRLARQLADEFGFSVRLWVDDLCSFSQMSSMVNPELDQQMLGTIDLRRWSREGFAFDPRQVADVVIEAFACEIPDGYLNAMRQQASPVRWINLEYLSAEPWVDEAHAMQSIHPHTGLVKHFFFPGFTAKTGGLLRERNILAERSLFDANMQAAFWKSLGLPPRETMNAGEPDELRVSLFCYENPALAKLLDCWQQGQQPIRLLVSPGPARSLIEHWIGESWNSTEWIERGSLKIQPIPFLRHAQYDRLLWVCNLNFVRGEDSFTRAHWAQQPFVWQIYPQAENAHHAKLTAFLDRFLPETSESAAIRRFWNAWNGVGDIASAWPDFLAARPWLVDRGKIWALQLDQQADLANNLVRFLRAI